MAESNKWGRYEESKQKKTKEQGVEGGRGKGWGAEEENKIKGHF